MSRRLFTVLLLVLLFISGVASAKPDRAEVLRTFRKYEAMNSEFISSVSTGTAISGKSYTELRRQVEAYAEGPFATALQSAQKIICKHQDQELLAALVQVRSATSNSASESATEALCSVAKCSPTLFSSAITVLQRKQQRDLRLRCTQ